MSETDASDPELVVRVGDIRHLFTTALDTDPLAQHECEVMGEPALVRYCTLKIEDNEAQLQLGRREAGRLLARGALILMVCVGLSSVFRSESFTLLPPLLGNAIGEGFSVIGWVMLWRPVEAFFFNPIPIRTSISVHRFLKSMQIEIRPQP